MAKIVVNPEGELPERAGDAELSAEQLATLAVFASMKKSPSFDKFPGTHRLRHYMPGEVVCSQGEPGKSAFYMLTDADLKLLFGGASSNGEQDAAAALAEAPAGASQPQRLATARLLIDVSPERKPARSTWARFMGGLRGKRTSPQFDAPQSIPMDGPTDIDYQSREAPIFAGEVFGEMSCLTRQPRSATIVADKECYALEFMRNVLDQMLRDPQYKSRSDAKYRDRVMEGHLRNLSLFRLLSDEQFRRAADRIELIDVPPGQVLWDEGDPPDAAYVVRSGIVKVIQDYPWRVEPTAVRDWNKLVAALADEKDPLAAVAKLLSPELKAALTEAAAAGPLPDALKIKLLQALNELAKGKDLLVAKELAEARNDPNFKRETDAFGPKPKDWPDLETRRGNRVLFSVLAPKLIDAPPPIGVARVRRYAGRGGTLGEIAVVRDIPRSASCVAYSHPGADFEATNVELVRVPGELLKELLAESPTVAAELDQAIQGMLSADQEAVSVTVQSQSRSRRVEDLGLMQGQKLMLIDLERCTRCGDCVEACIEAHDDGYSRLYLDGPRIGKYLAPSSCRMCRDPVCMIGCPVGSIQQGDAGQILIREWCIGCGVCARQCPYDSIQMHDLSIVASGSPGWKWMASRAEAPDNWSAAKFNDRHWQSAASPFRAGLAPGMANWLVRSGGPDAKAATYYFRYGFSVHAESEGAGETFKLTVTAQGGSPVLYLDGYPIELSQDAKQAKKGEWEAKLSAAKLRPGPHVLAASAQAPESFDAVIFDATIERLPREYEDVEVKLVSQQAVVCDQCSSLSGDRHACVYACPHEAAMRIDAWIELPQA